VRTEPDEPALIEHQDSIGVAGCCQMMRDEDQQPVLSPGGKAFFERDGRLGIKKRGRLIERRETWIADDGAGDGEPLTLSARQVAAVLLEFRIKTVRHGLDEVERVGKSQRATDAGIIGTRDPGGDVLADRARKQDRVLVDDADARRSERGS